MKSESSLLLFSDRRVNSDLDSISGCVLYVIIVSDHHCYQVCGHDRSCGKFDNTIFSLHCLTYYRLLQNCQYYIILLFYQFNTFIIAVSTVSCNPKKCWLLRTCSLFFNQRSMYLFKAFFIYHWLFKNMFLNIQKLL